MWIIMFILLLTAWVILKIRNASTYWHRKGIPHLERALLVNKIGAIYPGTYLKYQYDKIKSKGFKHAGLYALSIPVYVPLSPDLVRCILQQDFSYFMDKGFYHNEKDDPISANLFALGGEKWRHIRTKLSPSFTLGKTKSIFDLIVQCGNRMETSIEELRRNNQPVAFKKISANYTTDIVSSCIYGMDSNSFEHYDSELITQREKIFKVNYTRFLGIFIGVLIPRIAQFFGITVFPKETRLFFVKLMENAVRYRKDSGVIRKDFLQSLILLLDKDENNNCLTMEEISAQAFVFFAAGYETSSITITFCLYELAINPAIQEAVRNEILSKKDEHNLSYNSITEMKYLDQVIDETLRKYPPVAFLIRACTKDYKLPSTDTILEKGTLVAVSVLGLHRDPEYFPGPDKFDPERFSDENKRNIRAFTYLPFGEGPRICIGLKFGLLQVKVALVMLLSSYRFSLSPKTVEPIKMDPYSFTMVPKDEIHLNVEPLL